MSEKIKAWAFENKNEAGRFLCDGMECEDFEHENGDVADLSQALVAFRKDFTEPTEEDLEEFQTFMRGLKFVINWDEDVEPKYNPKLIELSPEQLGIIRERND